MTIFNGYCLLPSPTRERNRFFTRKKSFSISFLIFWNTFQCWKFRGEKRNVMIYVLDLFSESCANIETLSLRIARFKVFSLNCKINEEVIFMNWNFSAKKLQDVVPERSRQNYQLSISFPFCQKVVSFPKEITFDSKICCSLNERNQSSVSPFFSSQKHNQSQLVKI